MTIELTIAHLGDSADLLPNVVFGSAERRTGASYVGELTEIRLREALTREKALHRQIDKLILQHQAVLNKLFAWRQDAANHLANLSPRQRQVMALVVGGHHNKNIAAELGISQRTVENHRASIMKKTGSKSLPALARLALAAAWIGAPDPGP
ncbi:MAG: LuxR C-terminal-related transcriptional regulator [Stellaceae bacterium]